jgi:hypothetical protein
MPTIQYSKKDLLRDKIVSPGWYRVVIDEVGEWTPSADKQSNNMVMQGTIMFNADNGDKANEGVPIGGMGTWSFNSKGIGFSLGLTKAVASQLGLDPEGINENSVFEYKLLEGKQVDVFIANDTYQGRVKNKVNHQYRAPKV